MELSLRDHVGQLLTEYANLVHQFLQSLTTIAESTTIDEPSGSSSPDQLIQRIVDLDVNLQSALEKIEQHQIRQRKIISVQEEIQRHQLALLTIVEKLHSASTDLDQDLTKASKELKAASYAEQSNVSFTDILSYASKLSKYTSAPPNFELMSRDVRVDFEKPYPDEERMRRGLLYWQHSAQPPSQEEQFEDFESEGSSVADQGVSGKRRDSRTSGERPTTAEEGGDALWILDLNPDLA